MTQLRAARPNLGLSTDIIVGFPGETEADFGETLDLVRQGQLEFAFVFKYSPRRDTPAAAMPGQVPEEVREERHARLLELVTRIGGARFQQMVGQTVPVLVEGPSRRNAARLEGRTRCNKIVVFEGSPRHVGRLLDVRITAASAITLYGEPAILNPDNP